MDTLDPNPRANKKKKISLDNENERPFTQKVIWVKGPQNEHFMLPELPS